MTERWYREVAHSYTDAKQRWTVPVGANPMRRGGRNGVIPAVVLDYLETHGDMTLPELIDTINETRDLKPDSIRAAVRRMVRNKRVRKIPHWYGLDTYTVRAWNR